MSKSVTRTVDQKLIDADFCSDQEAAYELFTKMRQEDPVHWTVRDDGVGFLVDLQACGLPCGTRRCRPLQHRYHRANAAIRRRASLSIEGGVRLSLNARTTEA